MTDHAFGNPGQAGMAGTTFDAGGGGHVMMSRTGFAAVVAVLATAKSGHAAVAVGTGSVLREMRLMVLILGISRAPGRGVVAARATVDGRERGMTGDAIPGIGRGRLVMLVAGAAVGPGPVATFAAGHYRQGGMTVATGLAVAGGEIMMGIPRFPLVAILTTLGVDHARVTDGAGAVLGGGGGMVLIASAASIPVSRAMAIDTGIGRGDSGMAGRAVDRYGRIAEQIVVIAADIGVPGVGGVTAGAGSRSTQTGMAGTAIDTVGGGHVVMGGTGIAADMAGVAVILGIEGSMTEGTGHLRAGGQGMMTAAGIPLRDPVGGVVAAHTGGIAARRIAVAPGAIQSGLTGHLVVMEVAGFSLMAILAIVFRNDAHMANTAFDARRGRDIVMAGSRFPLVTGMAVLLQGHTGMTDLTLLAGGGSLKMVAGASVTVLPPVVGVVATDAAAHRRHGGMTGIAADILGRGSDMVGGAGVAAVTTLATFPAL